jgi:hypothetical protein
MNSPRPPLSPLLSSCLSNYSRARRLEDRIRKLCADAVAAADPAELNSTLQKLSAALRDHARRVRQLAAARPNLERRRRR